MRRLFLFLYQTIMLLGLPIFYLLLFYRLYKGKEDHISIREKTCRKLKTRPEGKLIWIHVASVGEFISAAPLIREIHYKEPDIHFLITSITINSAKLFKKYQLKNTVHQFLPLDNSYHLHKFFKHYAPDCGIFIDSEIWPNLIYTANQYCKLALINARISPKSYNKWQKARFFAEYLLQHFQIIMPYSEPEVTKFTHLCSKTKVKYLVNLKYLSPSLNFDANELENFKAYVQNRNVWLAASTHDGEEQQIIAAHKILKKSLPNILTIIVPRHPERGNDIKNMIMKEDLKCYLRSQNDVPDDQVDIYVANTLNELGLFYSLAPIAFIGGSLTEIGGHNILEAVRLDAAIVVGVHTFNFYDIIENFKKEKALIEVKDYKELAMQLEYLFRNPTDVEILIKNAHKIMKANSGNFNSMINEINKHLQIYSK